MALELDKTETGIGNLALQAIKAEGVANLDNQKIKAVRAIRKAYPLVRDGLLRDISWTFNKWRTVLSPDPVAPSFGFSRRYKVPAGTARVNAVDGYVDEEWDVESDEDANRYILINADETATLNVILGRYVTDVSRFDPLFIELCSLMLAKAIAPEVAADQGAVKDLKGMIEDARNRAVRTDNREQRRFESNRSRWLEARRVGGPVHG